MFYRPVDSKGLCVLCKTWECTSQEHYTLGYNEYVVHDSCWKKYKLNEKQWMPPEYYTKKRKSPEDDDNPDAEFYDT